MKTLVMVVILVTLLAVPAFAYDWVTNPANGHRYTLVFSNTSWQDAEDKAAVLGGHLVTIRSQAENDWVFDFTVSATSDTTPTVYGAWMGMYQIQGSVEPNEGWVWSSGEPVVYTNWQKTTGEPNDYYGDSSEDWAKMYIRQHDWDEIPSYWNDTWFYEPARSDTVGIVEVIPEPSSLLALCGGAIGLIASRRKKKVRDPKRKRGGKR